MLSNHSLHLTLKLNNLIRLHQPTTSAVTLAATSIQLELAVFLIKPLDRLNLYPIDNQQQL